MAGIPLLITDRVVQYPAVWAEAEEVPTIFVAVRSDGSVGLVHPEFVADSLSQVLNGDTNDKPWEHLLVKTPDMDYPMPCELMSPTLDTVNVFVGAKQVARLTV
jgi:hypothetical protein